MYSVDVHPDVYRELEYSREWYEERADNLGTEFLDEVDQAIETVRKAPAVWAVQDKERGIRRYLVHRFPYAVMYRIKDRTAQIVAIMHFRRHPGYWRNRRRHWKEVGL
jgi:plasmid stabilization system protein ParE